MSHHRRTFLKLGAGVVAASLTLNRAFAQWKPSWKPTQRYPDPAIVSLDSSFDQYRLASAKVEQIASGQRWAEGPVWFGDFHALLWSDIPNNRIMRWDELANSVSIFRGGTCQPVLNQLANN